MTNELIEAMAAVDAMHDRLSNLDGYHDWSQEFAKVKAALSAARHAGYRLVPVEPTPEMMAAYHRASIAPVSSLSLHGYRAMLAAAPDHVEQVRPMVGDHVADASKMVKEVGRD